MPAAFTRILVLLVALATVAAANARLCDATGRVRLPAGAHGDDCCCAPLVEQAAAAHGCCAPADAARRDDPGSDADPRSDANARNNPDPRGDARPLGHPIDGDRPLASFVEASACVTCGPAVPPQKGADERGALPPLALTLLPIADAPPLRWPNADRAVRVHADLAGRPVVPTTLLALGAMLTC